MPDLKEHSFNVFVSDKSGHAIPGAVVEILIDGDALAGATTKSYRNAHIRVQLSPELRTVTLRATVKDFTKPPLVREAVVGVDVGQYAFTFEEVEMPEPEAPAPLPAWFPVAGYITGVGTLLFFMYVALGGVTTPTFAHQAVLALGVGLASAFLTGTAAAQGKIPFLKDSPLAISVGGGIAAFLITLVVLHQLWG